MLSASKSTQNTRRNILISRCQPCFWLMVGKLPNHTQSWDILADFSKVQKAKWCIQAMKIQRLATKSMSKWPLIKISLQNTIHFCCLFILNIRIRMSIFLNSLSNFSQNILQILKREWQTTTGSTHLETQWPSPTAPQPQCFSNWCQMTDLSTIWFWRLFWMRRLIQDVINSWKWWKIIFRAFWPTASMLFEG